MRLLTCRNLRARLVALSCCAIISALAVPGCQHGGRRTAIARKDATIRAIWVTRWDYKTPRDIHTIMNNCRQAGFNTILFQVRGSGTAFYRSSLEPWADELGGRDPGFDPLSVACKEAHRQGLRIHAWMNVMPGWRGKKPPTNPRQLYNAHPDWFLTDGSGRRQPLGWYCSLNPCLPQVRKYLVAVAHEVVSQYPVDGLHLDYIRFPIEWTDAYPKGASVPDYPRDSKTLAIYHRETGKHPDASPRHWAHWRTEKVTQLVGEIRSMMRKVKPGIVLSAATGADADRARRAYFQDAQAWIARHLVDMIYPMNYAEDMRSYNQRVVSWASAPSRVSVVMGIMFDKRRSQTILEQVNLARRKSNHFAAFAYNSLFERLDENGHPIRDEQSRSRASLREQVLPRLPRKGSS